MSYCYNNECTLDKDGDGDEEIESDNNQRMSTSLLPVPRVTVTCDATLLLRSAAGSRNNGFVSDCLFIDSSGCPTHCALIYRTPSPVNRAR